MRKPKWSVERVKKSFHQVSPEEMKRKLAEVWEILLAQKSQPVQIPVLVSSPVHLLPKRRGPNG